MVAYTLEAAKKKFKYTIWIVHGILFRRDFCRTYIEEINEAFRFMCDQLKVVYRDPNTSVPDRALQRDGLHLNNFGTALLTDFILQDVAPSEVERKSESNGIRHS